jgi:hypothetical protein
MVNFRSEKFFVCLAAALLTFFIAGLLYLLRFERVDNLGAYRIPPETGILIPSVRAEPSGDESLSAEREPGPVVELHL